MRRHFGAKAVFIGYRNSSLFEWQFQILGKFSALLYLLTRPLLLGSESAVVHGVTMQQHLPAVNGEGPGGRETESL